MTYDWKKETTKTYKNLFVEKPQQCHHQKQPWIPLQTLWECCCSTWMCLLQSDLLARVWLLCGSQNTFQQMMLNVLADYCLVSSWWLETCPPPSSETFCSSWVHSKDSKVGVDGFGRSHSFVLKLENSVFECESVWSETFVKLENSNCLWDAPWSHGLHWMFADNLDASHIALEKVGYTKSKCHPKRRLTGFNLCGNAMLGKSKSANLFASASYQIIKMFGGSRWTTHWVQNRRW